MRGRAVEGGANGFAPGVGAEGVDVFVLGQVDGLEEGLGQISEGGGGFGFDLALGYGGEEVAQCGTEVAGGQIVAGEVGGEVTAYLLSGSGLGFFSGVEGTEMRMGGVAWGSAAAAIGERE